MADSNIAINVNDIGKCYKIYDHNVDRLKEALHPFRKKLSRDFWALRNINIQIKKGEAIGIIGTNGSGKSTLLQILTGVLEPTEGTVETNGRISALLELGAGFDPEFSGRDNVYMNGAILGFSKSEIDEKFESIAAFADIGEFIDQPVKTYSSGMFVRVAFAVAVHTDPEILIVDEALSVGDLKFQMKCLRKMQEFREEGKTFILVTHSIDMVRNFCDRVLWMMNGKIHKDGVPKEVVRSYSNFMCSDLEGYKQIPDINTAPINLSKENTPDSADVKFTKLDHHSAVGEGGAEILQAAFYLMDQYTKRLIRPVTILEGDEWVAYIEDIFFHVDMDNPSVCINIFNDMGILIFGVNRHFLDMSLPPFKRGQTARIRFEFRVPLLKTGKYSITTGISNGTYENTTRHHTVHESVIFDMLGKELSQRHQMITIEGARILYEHAGTIHSGPHAPEQLAAKI